MNRCIAMLIGFVMWAVMMLVAAHVFYSAIPVRG